MITAQDYYDDGASDARRKAEGYGNDYNPPAYVPNGFEVTLAEAVEAYDRGFAKGVAA